MTDYLTLTTAIFSAIATGLAALATWQAPRAAAKLAEALRRDSEQIHERTKNKLHVFATLMQERGAIYTENAVRAVSSDASRRLLPCKCKACHQQQIHHL